MTAVTKDTKLAEILKRPGAGRILEKFNTPCMHCPMAAYEMGTLKIGEVAKVYGLNLAGLLKELNATRPKAGSKASKKGKK
jgi:hypothetical protein